MRKISKDLSLLYAEDEEKIRANYVRYFKTLFHTVYEASDGEESLALYNRYRPDILVLDIAMPKLDGLSLSKKIREHDDRTPIIILTAHLDKENLLVAVELRLTKYLAKPVRKDDLLDALSNAVGAIEKREKWENYHLLEGGCTWDIKGERLIKNETEIILTNNEKRLCLYLIGHIGQTCPIKDILSHFWYAESPVDMNDVALRGLLKRLKKKVTCPLIKNIHGVGYRIDTLKNNTNEPQR